MANIVIAHGKLSDTASFTASHESTGLPATNLQSMSLGAYWRAENLTPYIVIDLGSAQPITFFAMLGLNVSSSATIRLRGATSVANLTASPGYDTTALTVWSDSDLSEWRSVPFTRYIGGPNTYRYWRVDFSDPSNLYGYIQASRLILAAAWQPSINIDLGWQIGWDDQSELTESLGGEVFVNPRARRRTLSFSLGFHSEDDMYDNAFDIDRLRGNSQDVIVVRDPNATSHKHRQTVYGLLTGYRPIVNFNLDLYRWQATVRELVDPNEQRTAYLTWSRWTEFEWDELLSVDWEDVV